MIRLSSMLEVSALADTASNLQALAGFEQAGLHTLKGDKRDFWSVDVDGPWRIVFRFKDGDAYDLHILDPH
jgi:proteic killer suppression protein